MNKIAPYAKAVTATIVAGLGTLGTALTDGAVTPVEWVAIATATLVASFAVWATPKNAETDGGV